MQGLIYLASPYSHQDADVREGRFYAVCEAAAILMRDGHLVYSPIAATHPIATRHEMPLDWAYWQKLDERILSSCDCIVVLTIDGWDISVGVTAEVQIAERLKLPLHFIEVVDGQVKLLQSFEIPA